MRVSSSNRMRDEARAWLLCGGSKPDEWTSGVVCSKASGMQCLSPMLCAWHGYPQPICILVTRPSSGIWMPHSVPSRLNFIGRLNLHTLNVDKVEVQLAFRFFFYRPKVGRTNDLHANVRSTLGNDPCSISGTAFFRCTTITQTFDHIFLLFLLQPLTSLPMFVFVSTPSLSRPPPAHLMLIRYKARSGRRRSSSRV